MAESTQLSFSDTLMTKLVDVEDALPKNTNKSRFVQNCLAVLNDKPELAKVNRNQLVLGLIKAAYLGVDFAQNEAYLVPYGNTVQFQLSYKGSVKFVKRYSIRPIKDVYSKVVRQGDDFEEKIIDGRPSIDFKPVPFNDSDITGAFAVVLYEDGGLEYETMTTREINDVRNNYSKACNSKAWKSSWSEMAKKTVLRRLCKHIETDFESAEAMKAWEDGADADFNDKKERYKAKDIYAESVVNEEEIFDTECVDVEEAAEVIDNE